MKTKPMKQQAEALVRMYNRNFFAVGAEQGTGKTWIALADAELLFERDEISGLLVVTLNGVHDNWVRREIPMHLSVPHHAVAWNSKAGKKAMRRIEFVLNTPPDELAILTMNIEAINTLRGGALAQEFVDRFRTCMVVDESQIIKNPTSKANKQAKRLGAKCPYKRILSGTLVADKPLDLYGQYDFLRPGLLGTTSYQAFVSQYAEVLPPHHPLVVHAAGGRRGTPQIIARDRDGAPRYKNLKELKSLMKPHTFRVLKKDCMELPEKIYQTHYFDLLPAQRRMYDAVKNDLRLEVDGSTSMFEKLSAQTKLQQITSGYIMLDGKPTKLIDPNPRTSALCALLQNIEGAILVWAKYKAEVMQIAEACEKLNVPWVTYHGDTSPEDRIAAVDKLQAGEARVFIATEAAARGLTLTAAETSIYYSNSFKREVRAQSEDRNHRKGTVNPVVYIDLVAKDTIDEKIAAALQTKTMIADFIMDF